MRPVRPFARRTVAGAFALAAVLLISSAIARSTPDALRDVRLADLPREARETYVKILEGGPLPHDRDGAPFGNRERLLPPAPRGYYHEYTVATPGAANRGARRIVCGGPRKTPDACYYTSDHYQSFRRIRE
jgi:ribonuclease T1